MFREKTIRNEKPVIDLDGPDGNVFALMGHAKRWAKDLGLNGKDIVTEMTMGDYDDALRVMEKYFGDYVIFETRDDARVKGVYDKFDS